MVYVASNGHKKPDNYAAFDLSALQSYFYYTKECNMKTMSNIETSFDEYKTRLVSMLYDKVDADLAMKIMYLERKLPDVEPKAELDVKVKNDIIASNLKDKIGAKFGYQVSCHKNHLTVVGLINMEKLAKLASNSDIEWITGNATPASY